VKYLLENGTVVHLLQVVPLCLLSSKLFMRSCRKYSEVQTVFPRSINNGSILLEWCLCGWLLVKYSYSQCALLLTITMAGKSQLISKFHINFFLYIASVGYLTQHWQYVAFCDFCLIFTGGA